MASRHCGSICCSYILLVAHTSQWDLYWPISPSVSGNLHKHSSCQFLCHTPTSRPETQIKLRSIFGDRKSKFTKENASVKRLFYTLKKNNNLWDLKDFVFIVTFWLKWQNLQLAFNSFHITVHQWLLVLNCFCSKLTKQSFLRNDSPIFILSLPFD